MQSNIEVCAIFDSTVDYTNENNEKYGKKYIEAKEYFMEAFDSFLLVQNDKDKRNKLVKEVRRKMFDHIGIILTYDIDNLVSKIILTHIKVKEIINILDYIDCIFNKELYDIMIKNIVYQKINDNIALCREDKLYFIGIIKIETLKIMIINNIMLDDTTEEEYVKLSKDSNVVNIKSLYNNINTDKYIEEYIKHFYVAFFEERIKDSLNTLFSYYNEVKTNFAPWKDVISSCSNIILNNGIFDQLKKIKNSVN